MKNLLFACLTAIIIAIVYSIDNSGTKGLNFDITHVSKPGPTWWVMLWIFLCMIIGIFFGQAYRALATIQGPVISSLELKTRIFNADLWRSLLSAPIVFGAIYLVARDQPDIIVSSILAFENGFICNVIAEKRIKELANA